MSKVTICFRLDKKLLEEIDKYCRSQKIPLQRSALIESAIKDFLIIKLGIPYIMRSKNETV